jgi:vitamin B12 transporter
VTSLCTPAAQRRDVDPLELYASAIDTSDYAAALVPLIRSAVPGIGRLLDVGAGGGQLGAALGDPALPWTAIEPSATMRARLGRLAQPPRLIAAGWESADVPARCHDTVLAATMPAFFEQPEAFLARCLVWARCNVVWVVPAHAGPRGLCFAGCLPSEWHREDETSGLDIVMQGLAPSSRPNHVAFAHWTFSGIVKDLDRLSAYLADRLGWAARDLRRAELKRHLVGPGPGRRRRRAPRHCQEISRSFLGEPMNNPCIRKSAAAIALLSGLAWIPPAVAQQPPQSPLPAQPQPPPQQPAFMPEVVVTATGYPEEVSKIAGTVQVISQDRIAHSNAKSVTELLAENSVGFMSQWTAGQTSLNIRGGATEGQGRDFKSEVLILINSHRAGTANISKLSIADVERVEIVRGPASVVYGSQNMGGVVNIILKTGRTAEPGTFIEGAGGSWNYVEGKVQNAGNTGTYDWYAGGNGARQGDYQVGGGQVELNTAWNRYGGTGAFGWQIDPNNRIDVTARSDGVYGTGFRGSSANIFANDNRYNDSIDFTWHGKTPSDRAHFMFQGYYVYDVDDLGNPSPFSNLNALASRTTIDENRRQLNIVGFRMQPRFNIIPSNELLVGVDWEQTSLSSTRFRAGGTAVTQLSPQDNNELNRFWGFYAEDTQQLFDDRLTVRGGVRQTFGTQGLLVTPNAPTLIPGTVTYQATTYSAGATYRATEWLNTRIGASSGFRAPTATELGANFTVTPIGTTIFGNPSLQPETSQQLEVGSTFTWGAGRLDLALFQNVIHNRIQSVTLSSVGGVVVQQSQNSQGDLWMQGLELQAEADVIRTLKLNAAPSWQWTVFGNGYYNFNMTDFGAAAQGFNTSQAIRVNQYGANIGTRFGRLADVKMPWNVQLAGILRGPMWYNTEEALSPVYFPGQVRNVTVYQKSAFWVWNMRSEIEVYRGVKMFGMVNNILDVNQSPIFIALDQNPCGANLAAQNGSCGNSMPGRELVIGFQARF